MQAGAASSLAGAAPELPAAAATALAWVGASLVFGAAHAITPTYFWFATGAGALFGELLPGGRAWAVLRAGWRQAGLMVAAQRLVAHLRPLPLNPCRCRVPDTWTGHRRDEPLAVRLVGSLFHSGAVGRRQQQRQQRGGGGARRRLTRASLHTLCASFPVFQQHYLSQLCMRFTAEKSGWLPPWVGAQLGRQQVRQLLWPLWWRRLCELLAAPWTRICAVSVFFFATPFRQIGGFRAGESAWRET